MALKATYKDVLVKLISKHIPGCTIYLFGSRATDTEGVGSDIDIALDAGTPIPYKTMLKILIDIDETNIPMKVDLIDMRVAGQVIKESVIKEGVKWTN
jgi:hypothetical protein